MKVAVVIEGEGDERAVPCLIAKTGLCLGIDIHTPDPIKCGGIHKLVRPGELERFARLAASKPGVDSILILVDLDDGCAADFHAAFTERLAAIAPELGVDARVCFCVREYECWFLEDLENLKQAAPEYDWVPAYACENAPNIRGAKGYLNRGMSKHYKETIDQLALTRKLNYKALFAKSRSFKKFARALTGFEYDVLELGFAI